MSQHAKPRSRRRILVTWISVLAGIYLTVALTLFVFQARLIFIGANFATRQITAAEDVEIKRLLLDSIGGTFRIAHAVPDEGVQPKGVMLFFGGNGEDLYSGVSWARMWRDYDLEAVFVEYPGYGESDGSPSITTVLGAASVGAKYAAARASALGVPLFVGGVSLGTFSATHVAARWPEVQRLFLSAPPTRLVDTAAAHYPWLPVRWLIRHRFDNLVNAAAVSCKAMVIHGGADSVVPQSMGRKLAEALRGRSEFVEAAGFGHMVPLQRVGPFGRRVEEFLFED